MDSLSVMDVAAYLLRKHGAMSAMKLQKLVYYCQAWMLALLDRELFFEQVQAWAYGPVVYELFMEHRGRYIVSEVRGDPSRCEKDADIRTLLDKVYDHYGPKSATQLKDQTHAESPWLRAYQETRIPGYDIISKESMRDFYRAQTPPWGQTHD